LKEQVQQRLTVIWSGIQQTVIAEATDKWRRYIRACVRARDAILNICRNGGCSVFSVNIFTLNAEHFMTFVVSCCSNAGVRVHWHAV